MFHTWGTIVSTYPRRVLGITLVLLIASLAVLIGVGPRLSSEGFVPNDSESVQVVRTLERDFHQNALTIVLLFDASTNVDDPSVRNGVEATINTIADEPWFGSVETFWSGGNRNLVSNDGRSTYAVVTLAPDTTIPGEDVDTMIATVEAAAAGHGLAVTVGGTPVFEREINAATEESLVRAEVFSIPITLIILVLVFGGLVAAGLPLVIGAIAIAAAFAIITVWSHLGFQSVFAANVLTMLGLGLGIDYSLFMVSRFREELGRHTPAEAVVITMSTVGNAILFSGITVIIGLMATQFFDLPMLQSLGQAGMVVTAMALVFGLSTLPALLTVLGDRVNRFGLRTHRAGTDESPFWHRIASGVMRRPVIVLVACLLILLGAAIPITGLKTTLGGPDSLPRDAGARIVAERLSSGFPADEADTIIVIATLDGVSPASPDGVQRIQQLSAAIGEIDGVSDVLSFAAPSLGIPWQLWNGDVQSLPQPLQQAIAATVHDNAVLLRVSSSLDDQGSRDLIRDLRAIDQEGVHLQVGGTAAAGVDTLDRVRDGLVPAIAFVLIAGYVILLLSFGSLFLPLKAMFMASLSIAASLGVVVWVFQEGHFEELLGFQATGEIVVVNPILIACVLFGLSMDYEVLMLSRIQETYARTGDNTASVATGLSHTGNIVTGAAAIMVIVFGGFVLADIVIIKSLGFGLALAVLLDATIVRGLLVPATMRLMGRWNWWAPGPVTAFVDRVGLRHGVSHPPAGDPGVVRG